MSLDVGLGMVSIGGLGRISSMSLHLQTPPRPAVEAGFGEANATKWESIENHLRSEGV